MRNIGQLVDFLVRYEEQKKRLEQNEISLKEYEILLFKEFDIELDDIMAWSPGDIRGRVANYYGTVDPFDKIAEELVGIVGKYK